MINLDQDHGKVNVKFENGKWVKIGDGIKRDDGKARWDLLPLKTVAHIVRVLEHGVKVYGENTWQNIDRPYDRYYSAIMRHLNLYQQGEYFDQESELPHLAHVFTNCMFLLNIHDDDI